MCWVAPLRSRGVTPPFLRAGPKGKLAATYAHRIVTVNEKDNQRDVAKKMTKYNLLALPVVDDEEKLKGLVTVDDALDMVLPTGWKAVARKLVEKSLMLKILAQFFFIGQIIVYGNHYAMDSQRGCRWTRRRS